MTHNKTSFYLMHSTSPRIYDRIFYNMLYIKTLSTVSVERIRYYATLYNPIKDSGVEFIICYMKANKHATCPKDY